MLASLARLGMGIIVCATTAGCAGAALPSVRSVAPPASVSLFDPPWSWIDEQGVPVAFEQYRGAPIVLTAIFTSCTVRCPLTIDKLRQVDAHFQHRHAPVRIVLVTLDPHIDTPERLRRFKQSRHLPDDWHLLQGSDIDTRALGRYLNIRALFDDAHIDHNVRIAVFDAGGHPTLSFADWGFDPEALASISSPVPGSPPPSRIAGTP